MKFLLNSISAGFRNKISIKPLWAEPKPRNDFSFYKVEN